MTEPAPGTVKKPGVVIFVAVLNFLSVVFFLLSSIFSLVALVFGNVMGLSEWVTRAMTQFSPSPNFSYGITFIFGAIFAVCLFFFIFFLLIGIGLLKGSKLAWYLQIAMSVLGLLGFPIGTILNALILVFFFQAPVRDYFKV